MKKIAVVTPAGQVGRQVVSALLKKEVELILIGREGQRSKFSNLLDSRVSFRAAGLDQLSELTHATEGADALFWLTPPNTTTDMREWYQSTARAAAAAVRENGIKRVVNLSAIGAGAAEGLGTVTYVGETERLLNAASQNVVHLRPGYFMENLNLQKDSIAKGQLVFPFDPDHKIPWIAAKDIGDRAAEYLGSEKWAGHIYHHLMGPKSLTPLEVAEALKKHRGHDVRYVQSSYEDLARSFKDLGLPKEATQDLVLTFKALGDKSGVYGMPRTHETQTPTDLSEFLRKNERS